MITTLTKDDMGKFLLETVRNRRTCPECGTHNNVTSVLTLFCFDCEVSYERNADMRDIPKKEVSNA